MDKLDKSEIWSYFVDSMSTAVAKRNEFLRKKEEHNAGGSYCPFSDTYEGGELAKDSMNAEISARKYLDMYLKPTSAGAADDVYDDV